MRNLFGYEKFSRSIGDCLLHATVVPCDDGFLSSVTVEDENRVLYRRESKFASSHEATIHLHLQLERIAAKGPLSIPGMHSYDVPAGPIGVELRVHVFDPEQEWEKFAPRAEVLIDLDDVGLQLEDLEDYDQDILTGVSKFIGFPVRWADNQWHQNRSRNNPGWYRGTWSRNLSLPSRPKKSSEESGEFDTHEEPSIGEVKPKLHYFSRRADMEGVPPRLFRPWAAAHDAKERFAADSTVANFDEFVQATSAFLQSAAPFGSALAGQTLPTVQQYVAQHPPANGELYSQQEAERYMTYIDRIINRVHEDMLKATGTTREEWYAAKGTPTVDPHASTPVMYLTPEEQAELGIFQKAPPQEKGPQAPFTEELWRRRTQGSVKTAEVLEHYSRQPNLTVVDPKYHGQGIAGAERRRKSNNPEYWVDRAYFYDAGSSPEAELANEQRYVAQLPAGAAIYDLGTDPDNLATNALNEMGTPDVTRMERAVKDAGYFGFRNTRGPIPYAVGVFYPVQVQKAQDSTTAEMLITTMFVKHAGSTENYLQSIGAQPDVIQFIMKQEPETAKKLVNEVRKNVNLTGQELQQLVQTLKSKQQYAPTQREMQSAAQFQNTPGMYDWVLLQTKKYRKRKVGSDFASSQEWEYAWPEGTSEGIVTRAPGWSLSYIDPVFQNIRDWVEATRAQIASYDLPGALAASKKWHEEMAAKEPKKGEYEEKNVVHTFKNGWTIQEVRSEHDLETEGELMGHCVGGYCNYVASGESAIFSLRDPQNHPHVTMEVRPNSEYEPAEGVPVSKPSKKEPWKIIQVQGKGNREPIAQYKDMIREWITSLDTNHISMGGDDSDMYSMIYNMEPETWEDLLTNAGGINEYGIPAKSPIDLILASDTKGVPKAAFEGLYERMIIQAERYQRRGGPFMHLGAIAELAQLAWDHDVALAQRQKPVSDWDEIPEKYKENTSAMAGLYAMMDKNRERADQYFYDSGMTPPNENDYTNPADYDKAMETFEQMEADERENDYRQWIPGSMDGKIADTFSRLADENGGMYPWAMRDNAAHGRPLNYKPKRTE